MKGFNPIIAIFVYSLIGVASPFSAGAQQDTTVGIHFRPITLEQALVAAKVENKPVFMHCFASWCHYCKYMADSTFTKQDVGDFYNSNFICIKYDMEKEGAELNKTLNISIFPSQVFYDIDGTIMHRSIGRRIRVQFLALGKEALDPKRQMRTWKNKYDSGTATQYETYYYFKTWEHAMSSQQQTINDYLMRQHDTAITNAFNWRIIYDFMKDPTYPMMDRTIKFKKELEKKYTTDSVNNKLINTDVQFLSQYVRTLDSVGYEKLKEKIMNTKGLDIAEKICALADLKKFKMKSDWENYKMQARIVVKKHAGNDFMMINEITKEIITRQMNEDDLKTIEEWMKASVKMSDLYQSNFYLAKASWRLNKKDQALAAANHALELGQKEGVNLSEASALLEDIKRLP